MISHLYLIHFDHCSCWHYKTHVKVMRDGWTVINHAISNKSTAFITLFRPSCIVGTFTVGWHLTNWNVSKYWKVLLHQLWSTKWNRINPSSLQLTFCWAIYCKLSDELACMRQRCFTIIELVRVLEKRVLRQYTAGFYFNFSLNHLILQHITDDPRFPWIFLNYTFLFSLCIWFGQTSLHYRIDVAFWPWLQSITQVRKCFTWVSWL